MEDRKVMARVWLFFTCFLFLNFMGIPPANADTKADGKKKVVIIRYKLPPDNFDSTVASFKKEMAGKGYEEGKNIEYADLLTSTGDQSSIPEVEAWVDTHKDTADAFFTCGWVGMATRNKLKGTNIPQIFSFVFQPVGVNLIGGPLDKPSGSNITGVYLMYPPEKIMRLLKMLIPSAQKYGVVFNSKVPADQFFKKWHEEATPEQRQGVEFVYFDLAEGVDKVTADIKSSGVNAFGGGVSIRKPDFAPLFKIGIPVVGPKLDLLDPEKVKDTDELAGHYNPFDVCGSQAAKIVAEVFGGKKIEGIVPQPVEKQIPFINLVAAKRLGINITTTMLSGGNIQIIK